MKLFYNITPKPDLHDPQGEALQRILARIGVPGVSRVHVGKRVVLEIEGDLFEAERRERFEELGKTFFSNPLLEDVECRVESEEP